MFREIKLSSDDFDTLRLGLSQGGFVDFPVEELQRIDVTNGVLSLKTVVTDVQPVEGGSWVTLQRAGGQP